MVRMCEERMSDKGLKDRVTDWEKEMMQEARHRFAHLAMQSWASRQCIDRIAVMHASTIQWFDGAPPKPYSEEWFLAVTTFGDRVVLRALPDEYTYDFKTADETYIKRDKIARWAQFPDSSYVPYDADQIRRDEREKCARVAEKYGPHWQSVPEAIRARSEGE